MFIVMHQRHARPPPPPKQGRCRQRRLSTHKPPPYPTTFPTPYPPSPLDISIDATFAPIRPPNRADAISATSAATCAVCSHPLGPGGEASPLEMQGVGWGGTGVGGG